MGLETGSHINSLDANNPASTDGLSQADDHLRLIKSTIKNTFPSITGAVTASHSELNALAGFTGNTADLNALSGHATEFEHVVGVTSAIQTQLDAKAPLADPTFTGTVVAPTATITTANVTTATATTVNVSTLDLGQWTVKEIVTTASDPNLIGPPGPGDFLTKLEFYHTSPTSGGSPVAKMSIDASGNLTVVGNVTAFGTP